MMQKSKFDLNLSKNIIEQLVTVTEPNREREREIEREEQINMLKKVTTDFY